MKVLIAIKSSEDCDTACEVLDLLQWGDEDRAVVITVVPEHLAVRGRIDRGLEASGDQDTVDEVTEAEQIVQACAARMKTFFQSVETRVYAGAPEDEILYAAREIDADLIVVGTRVRSLVAEWFLGSVSHSMLRNSGCSVLIARPGAASISRIVVGYDGSQEADEALKWVAALVRPGTRVEVVSVAEPVPLVTGADMYLPVDSGSTSIMLNADSNDRAEEFVRTAVQRLKADGIKANATARFGSAALEILEAVAETPTDLVIVGAHSQDGWPDLFVGNTALKVAKAAPCSVWVARSCGAATQRAEKRDDFREGADDDALCEPEDNNREGP